ncbi:MAG: hypothetical protein J6N70_13760 [Oribacterium sp.]|nr:hypothetical protein [Oribacterium sp.]
MEFEKRRNSNRAISVWIMFLSLIGSILLTMQNYYIYALMIFLVGAVPYVICRLYDKRRDDCREFGERIEGQVIMAYKYDFDAYYLVISFLDNGEKTLLTEEYNRNPNFYLKDCKCIVYKWKGKYVEGSFNARDDGDISELLHIPICKRLFIPFWEIGRVKEL